jgi:hypothetical protein
MIRLTALALAMVCAAPLAYADEHIPLIVTARLSALGDVVVTLGDGGLICGPFTVKAPGDLQNVIMIDAGVCVGGTWPHYMGPPK